MFSLCTTAVGLLELDRWPTFEGYFDLRTGIKHHELMTDGIIDDDYDDMKSSRSDPSVRNGMVIIYN